jgi:hypothetical protein
MLAVEICRWEQDVIDKALLEKLVLDSLYSVGVSRVMVVKRAGGSRFLRIAEQHHLAQFRSILKEYLETQPAAPPGRCASPAAGLEDILAEIEKDQGERMTAKELEKDWLERDIAWRWDGPQARPPDPWGSNWSSGGECS